MRSALERCEAERDRNRQAAKVLVQLHSSVKDFAVIVLSPDGRVGMWNEGAQRLLGYTAEEITGQPGALVFPPDAQAQGVPAEELRNAVREGRAENDMFLQRKDGSRFFASGVTSPILGESGELEGFVKILRDLTLRKEMDDELRRLNTSLEERVRQRTAELEETLRELGAFAYSVAHDLRAPLRAMSGFAQALQEDYRDRIDAKGQQFLQRITDSAHRMDVMIQDLLEYSRLTQADIACVQMDPTLTIENVVAQLTDDISSQQASIVIEKPLPLVLAHEITLGQVFSNLLSNAIKFVAPRVRPQIRIRGERRPGWVRLWVEDNGIGIAPEHHGKIFGIFERLHPATEYPGTGIGLAIVNRAMDRMRGKAGVESSPGQGSRFWIDLRDPLASSPAAVA